MLQDGSFSACIPFSFSFFFLVVIRGEKHGWFNKKKKNFKKNPDTLF